MKKILVSLLLASLVLTGCTSKNNVNTNEGKKPVANTVAKPSIKEGYVERTIGDFSYQYDESKIMFIDYKSSERFERLKSVNSNSVELDIDYNYLSGQTNAEDIIHKMTRFEEADIKTKEINGSLWSIAKRTTFFKSENENYEEYVFVSVAEKMYYLVKFSFPSDETENIDLLEKMEETFYISTVLK